MRGLWGQKVALASATSGRGLGCAFSFSAKPVLKFDAFRMKLKTHDPGCLRDELLGGEGGLLLQIPMRNLDGVSPILEPIDMPTKRI